MSGECAPTNSSNWSTAQHSRSLERCFPGMTEVRANLFRIMPDAFPIFFEGRGPYEGQASAMPQIVKGYDVLFASPTASGKTEAAVTPLFQRHLSFRRQSLSTVYVAPTKALVNDLYERLVGVLGTRFPSAVARYTGDRHELGSASGGFCLLATPEALDSLQLRRPDALADVRAIVIDEIHLLHGQPRGQQLRHVMDRIQQASNAPKSPRDNFQIVGMTATLDDMETVGQLWLGEAAKGTRARLAARDRKSTHQATGGNGPGSLSGSREGICAMDRCGRSGEGSCVRQFPQCRAFDGSAPSPGT